MCNIQIYLGVLREAAGVVNDKLPESVAELRNPSSASVIAYRGKVAMLMEKYKIYYMQEGETADGLHYDYKQHRDALLNGVVNESVNLMGIKGFTLNREMAFELLQMHHTDIFKKQVVQFVRSVELKVCMCAIMFPLIYIVHLCVDICVYRHCQFHRCLQECALTNCLGKTCRNSRESHVSHSRRSTQTFQTIARPLALPRLIHWAREGARSAWCQKQAVG